MDIMKLVKENEAYLIEMRRYFHRFPESSGKEEKTVERISQELTKMGVEHVVVPNGGILGFIDGPTPGKTVLLRADVDALPMQEDPNNLKGPKVAVSEVDGVCQSCGHDGHTAMLLVAAKILNENKDQIKGRVIILFERGEEFAGNLLHIFKYMKDHNITADSSWGAHLYAMLESGKVSLRPGPVMAGAVGFTITIKGRGGHGSRPDQSVSPIDCFVALYNGMNTIRMKKVSPFNSLTFSVGSLHSGAAGNIIPDSLEFSGTARIFEMEDGFAFRDTLVKMMKDIGDAYDCEVTGKITGPALSVKNDPECAALAKKVLGEAIGQEHLEDTDPWMASESMSMILNMWPGVFALIGIQNEEKGTGAPHHNGNFDLDEDVLAYGAAGAVAYALGFLNSDLDTSDRKWKDGFAALYRYAGRPEEQVKYLED